MWRSCLFSIIVCCFGDTWPCLLFFVQYYWRQTIVYLSGREITFIWKFPDQIPLYCLIIMDSLSKSNLWSPPSRNLINLGVHSTFKERDSYLALKLKFIGRIDRLPKNLKRYLFPYAKELKPCCCCQSHALQLKWNCIPCLKLSEQKKYFRNFIFSSQWRHCPPR